MSRRTTIYVGVDGKGEPVFGLWDPSESRLAIRIADRVANGEAFPGEHVVRITVDYYNRIAAAKGWSMVSP